MAEPIVVGTEVKAITGSNNTKMIGMFRLTGSSGTNYVMVNSQTNTYYQVPVGKKCCIISMQIQQKTSSYGDVTVYSHNVANTTGGIMSYQGYSSFQSEAGVLNIKTYFEVPAGNYINVYISDNPTQIQMVGIEMDT
jgi:hypothetical protein